MFAFCHTRAGFRSLGVSSRLLTPVSSHGAVLTGVVSSDGAVLAGVVSSDGAVVTGVVSSDGAVLAGDASAGQLSSSVHTPPHTPVPGQLSHRLRYIEVKSQPGTKQHSP